MFKYERLNWRVMMIRFFFILIMYPLSLMATLSLNGISVQGYFNFDDKKDSLLCTQDGKDTVCKIVDSNISFRIVENNGCSELSIESCKDRGCIKVLCSNWGEMRTLFYIYDKEKNNFYLTKKIYEKLPMNGPNDVGYSKEYRYDSFLWSIDKKSFKVGNIKSLHKLDRLLSDLYKSKKYDKIKIVAQDIPNVNIKLSKKTLPTYNNIAYYLQKAGANKEAIYLLEKILQKYPNRTVAYYNIADAYWAIGEKEKAKEAYRTYIKQMKAKGKEKRIPKTVLKRAK